MDPWWIDVCSYDIIFKLVLNYDVINSVIITKNTNFVLKVAKFVVFFFIINICPNLWSNLFYHRISDRFQKILCISKLFGSRGGGLEILTMISVQKCQFLAKSEDWTKVYLCCSCKLILKMNVWYVYMV